MLIIYVNISYLATMLSINIVNIKLVYCFERQKPFESRRIDCTHACSEYLFEML